MYLAMAIVFLTSLLSSYSPLQEVAVLNDIKASNELIERLRLPSLGSDGKRGIQREPLQFAAAS